MQLWRPADWWTGCEHVFRDAEAANREARHIAQTAIRRDPDGFSGLESTDWPSIGSRWQELREPVAMEDGYHPGVQPTPTDWTAITGIFRGLRSNPTWS
jgi:hypothetical protein